MSKTTRTGPKANGVTDAFGPGNGLSHEFGLAMGKQRVNPSMLKRVVSDPLLQAQIGALVRGESLLPASDLNALVMREMTILAHFSDLAGSSMPSQNLVEEAFEKAVGRFGRMTEHDRFVPANLTLSILFGAVYAWNEEQEKADGTGIKLGHDPNEEWWRSEKGVEHIPTVAGVFHANLDRLMTPTDLSGRPFNLNEAEQQVCASEQGGDGLASAEEAFYLVLRNLLERNLPPWGAGAWLRCRNAYGQGFRLTVSWDADDGLFVGRRDLDECWYGGALPRKSPLYSFSGTIVTSHRASYRFR